MWTFIPGRNCWVWMCHGYACRLPSSEGTAFLSWTNAVNLTGRRPLRKTVFIPKSFYILYEMSVFHTETMDQSKLNPPISASWFLTSGYRHIQGVTVCSTHILLRLVNFPTDGVLGSLYPIKFAFHTYHLSSFQTAIILYLWLKTLTTTNANKIHPIKLTSNSINFEYKAFQQLQ